MIVVNLENKMGKMFVKSWSFVTKQASLTIKNRVGIVHVFSPGELPSGFYEAPKTYYVENDRLIKSFAVEEPTK